MEPVLKQLNTVNTSTLFYHILSHFNNIFIFLEHILSIVTTKVVSNRWIVPTTASFVRLMVLNNVF
jgi:hypothetical protein